MTCQSLVSATASVNVLLDDGVEINGREVGEGEGLLLHELFDIGILQNGASDGRAVAALVAGEVLDVVDGLREGVGDDGLLLDGGGAAEAVLHGQGQCGFVLRVRARARDLPWLLHEPLQGLHHRIRRRFRHTNWVFFFLKSRNHLLFMSLAKIKLNENETIQFVK